MHTLRTDWPTRLVATFLALGVVAAHVSDQGGITKLSDPHWIGWGYRLIEIGGLATATVIVLMGRWRPVWAAAGLLGLGPMVGYLMSRTVGLPGDSADVGNWGNWVGTMALLFEASLIIVAANALLGRPQASSAPLPVPARTVRRPRVLKVRH